MVAMGFRFVGQPFKDAEQLGAVITDALEDPRHDRAWIATAWGKRSGLSRIAGVVEAFRNRGGHVEAIVGVDEAGATTEGLRLALELFSVVRVFHDPGARTFHPKIYAVQGAEHAVAVVGSGNLTRGGLYTNYEGSIVADLNLNDAEDAEFLAGIRAYYDALTQLPDVCRTLDEQLIEELIADPSLVVVSEQQANRRRRLSRGQGRSPLFGGTAVPDLGDAPPPSVAPLLDGDEDDDDTLTATTSARAAEAESPSARPEAVWWKQLTMSDAHRKPATSHQRNGVVLNRAGHDIPWHTWFREELFGGLSWSQVPTRNGGVKDIATVPFEVFVEDRHLGLHEMVVDHAAARISGQGNTPTYLNWSTLLPEIRANDFRDWWLELARMRDGTYRLRLTPTEPSY